MITVSIVSHGHGAMVAHLTEQFLSLPEVSQIIVTLNIDEPMELPRDGRIQMLRNETPKGFGANHNAAFELCKSDFYCVVNPDIELLENPFPVLVRALEDPAMALAAPLVLDAQGQIEDSWRRFPSPLSLGLKAFTRHKGTYSNATSAEYFRPDWTAGMFLLFGARDYVALGGFDEGFFLYYEDVDLCARLHRKRRGIIACTQAQVVHKAQRASWHSLEYRRYHLASIARYFRSDLRRLFPAMMRIRA